LPVLHFYPEDGSNTLQQSAFLYQVIRRHEQKIIHNSNLGLLSSVFSCSDYTVLNDGVGTMLKASTMELEEAAVAT
jgi:hypothetical protein